MKRRGVRKQGGVPRGHEAKVGTMKGKQIRSGEKRAIFKTKKVTKKGGSSD
jgi:hypothetical protein